MTDLGAIDDFTQFPAPLEVSGRPFYLVKRDEGFALLSRICPHAGGEVQDGGDELYCPFHYWRFDCKTGHSIFPPEAPLATYDVAVENGRLIAAYAPPPPRY